MADQFLIRATTMDDILAAINKLLRSPGHSVGQPDKHGEMPVYAEDGEVVKDIYVLRCPADFRLFRIRK